MRKIASQLTMLIHIWYDLNTKNLLESLQDLKKCLFQWTIWLCERRIALSDLLLQLIRNLCNNKYTIVIYWTRMKNYFYKKDVVRYIRLDINSFYFISVFPPREKTLMWWKELNSSLFTRRCISLNFNYIITVLIKTYNYIFF